jgi:hypothetical protein
MTYTIPFYVVQRPNLGLGRYIVEVSRSHTIRYKQPMGLLCTSDQLVTEAATYTTDTNDRRPLRSAGFEPAIPAIEWPQTARPLGSAGILDVCNEEPHDLWTGRSLL